MSGGRGGFTGEDLGQFADCAEDLTDEAIRATERRVDLGPYTDETPWHGKLQLVGLGKKRDNTRVNRLAAITARAVLGDDTRADLDFHPETEHAREDRAARDAAFEFVDFRPGLVHVEGTDHDQSWVRGEVPHGNRDPLYDVLVHRVDVVFELCGDGHDGR